MTPKLLEIRDRNTTIPALAIQVSGADGFLMRRAGFGSPMVLLINLARMTCAYDPYSWMSHDGRTMPNAHRYIETAWDALRDGAVVDVEFILGETSTPKESESLHE